MLNRNLLAGTAAQKRFKCSLLQRPAIILAMLLLCAVLSTQAQTTTSSKDSMFLSTGTISLATAYYGTQNEYKYDTISVVLLVSDTLHYSNYTPTLNDANYFDKAGAISWVTAFAVREITIEKKGSHQSGDMMWFNELDKYYYATERYLDGNMKPLSKYIKVWMAVSK
jgi:hypothetical protein